MYQPNSSLQFTLTGLSSEDARMFSLLVSLWSKTRNTRAKVRMDVLPAVLFGRENRAAVSIPAEDILYVLSDDHRIHVCTVSGMHTMRLSFQDACSQLDSPVFLLCNRGSLVSLQHVSDCDGAAFLMDNGDRIPIRSHSKKEFRQIFSAYRNAQGN